MIMRSWSRWQDWTVLTTGVYTFLAPIWTRSTGTATGTLVTLGIVVALVAIRSLAAPGSIAPRWLLGLVGVLVFISPWVMGFHAVAGMAWTAWIVGAVTFVGVPAPASRLERAHALAA